MTTAPVGSAKESELRQRASKAANATASPTKTSTRAADAPSSSISLLDLLRFAAGIALASTVGSYVVTSGESYTWHATDPARRPWWLSPAAVQRHFKGPILLTNDQLAAYDGSNGSPIYLALNRTIYDMSASPHVYGPGGPYSQLAAKDASRSYITTCFDPVEDLVPYFGGVEEVYVPLWLSKKTSKAELDALAPGDVVDGLYASDLMEQVKSKIGRKNVRKLTEQAYAAAHERVKEQIRTWEGMFERKGYPIIGRVVGVDEEDPLKWRHLGFCEAAKKLRPPMTETLAEGLRMAGADPDKMDIKKMFSGKGKGKAADAEADKPKKKKKKSGKKKDKKNDGDEKIKMGSTNHASNEKANVRLEDMMKGGKYWDGDNPQAQKIQEMMKSGPMGGDPERAKQAMEALKKDKASKGEKEPLDVPEAVPEAVKEDAAKKADL